MKTPTVAKLSALLHGRGGLPEIEGCDTCEDMARRVLSLLAAEMEEARSEDRVRSYAHQAKGHAIRWLRDAATEDDR